MATGEEMKIRSISVVIPNYNGRQLLEENLPFLMEALRKSGADYEIIISDDSSTDGSVDFIKKNYPDTILIENKINSGFSPNINKGIFTASKELIFALNSDVRLSPDYFHNQFKYFEDKNTFGVMGRIAGLSDEKIQDGAKYPAMNFYKLNSTLNFLPSNQHSSLIPSLFLSGANALMDREKLIILEGYDEVFRPFYLEDVDLSLRAWRMGWASYYDDDSVCRHPASTTIGTYHKKQKIKTVSLTNKLILHYIHLDGIFRILWKAGLVLEFAFSWITLKISFYKGLFQFLGKLKEAKKSRKKLKKLLATNKESKSLNKVIEELKLEINKFPIRKF
jgi:GT2 family glycosyltransferase